MPCDYKQYPKDWKAIRAEVMARAGDRCEGTPQFPDCRVKHQTVYFYDRDGGRVEREERPRDTGEEDGPSTDVHMKPFEWKEFVCEWNDLSLVAGDDGSWSVLTPEGDYCGWRNQVKGSDFKDAQLRAQAAAMVLHKLRTKPDEHGRPDRTNSQ